MALIGLLATLTKQWSVRQRCVRSSIGRPGVWPAPRLTELVCLLWKQTLKWGCNSHTNIGKSSRVMKPRTWKYKKVPDRTWWTRSTVSLVSFGLCKFGPRSRTSRYLELVSEESVSRYILKIVVVVGLRKWWHLLDSGRGPLNGLDLMRTLLMKRDDEFCRWECSTTVWRTDDEIVRLMSNCWMQQTERSWNLRTPLW